MVQSRETWDQETGALITTVPFHTQWWTCTLKRREEQRRKGVETK